MPEEKETQEQTVSTQQVFAWAIPLVHLEASPRVVTHSQFRIVLDQENGNGHDHIGASLHQSYKRFLRIRFCKDDQHHDRIDREF